MTAVESMTTATLRTLVSRAVLTQDDDGVIVLVKIDDEARCAILDELRRREASVMTARETHVGRAAESSPAIAIVNERTEDGSKPYRLDGGGS